FALPLIAVFDADTLACTSPVPPVDPELPEMATGLDIDVDDAGPVFPVLVADDWATAAPESPDVADGATWRITDPPEPPFADATAIESPPETRALRTTRAAFAGGAETAKRLMPPRSPASTHSRDLRRIWFLPVAPCGPTQSATLRARVKQRDAYGGATGATPLYSRTSEGGVLSLGRR